MKRGTPSVSIASPVAKRTAYMMDRITDARAAGDWLRVEQCCVSLMMTWGFFPLPEQTLRRSAEVLVLGFVARADQAEAFRAEEKSRSEFTFAVPADSEQILRDASSVLSLAVRRLHALLVLLADEPQARDLNICKFLSLLEHHDLTLVVATRALSVEPEDSALLFARGDAHAARGENESASRDLRQSYDASPSPHSAARLSAVQLQKGDPDSAVRWAELAVEAGPTRLGALALRRAGEAAGSAEAITRAKAIEVAREFDPNVALLLDTVVASAEQMRVRGERELARAAVDAVLRVRFHSRAGELAQLLAKRDPRVEFDSLGWC